MAISVAFEGSEGVGKTIQLRTVWKYLKENMGLQVTISREPGGTDIGDEIREILKDEKNKDMHPRTTALLYNASRNELINKRVIPWKEQNPNGIFLTDRCWWSTLAYQTVDGEDKDYIKKIQEPFVDVWPDKVVYTDLHPMESKLRVERAKFMNEEGRWWRDFVGEDVYSSIRSNYLKLVKEYRDRTLLLDGFEHPARRVFDTITFILGKEPFEYTQEVEKDITDIWESHAWHSYKELLQVEARLRKDLNYPDKDTLRKEIMDEWKKLGIERGNRGVERR